MCFLKNRSSYSFETCTTVISMPENCRVQWVWPSKYKGKWHYSPKCIFSEMDNTDLKLVPLGSACLKTSGCTDFDPLNTKKSDVIDQNVFSQKWIIIQLWNLYHWDWHAWKPQGVLSLTLQIQRKVMLYPKCVFSEMDHHTALKCIPLQSACLKTSGCTDFDPLNTKESDVIAQNVFSQKWIIIQLWNLHHCNQHAWKPAGVHWLWPSKYKRKWCFTQNVFSQKWIIIQLWNLHHCNQHAWKLQGALSLTLQIQRKVML